MAAIDTHIKFDGVEGESTHVNHKGEIEVLSWSWSVANETNAAGGGMGIGKAVPGSLNFSHVYDKASPVIAKKSAQGMHFKDVTLTSAKSGEGQKDFLKVKLSEVFVVAVQHGQDGGGQIVEQVSLKYSEVEFSYKPQDDKGGLGGEVKFAWNIKSTKIT